MAFPNTKKTLRANTFLSDLKTYTFVFILTVSLCVSQYNSAAVLFQKMGKVEDASRAYETALNFGRAVEILYNLNHFNKAIDCVERFNMTLEVWKKSFFLSTWNPIYF